MSEETSAAAGQKRRRTRSGCLNCRRKRKKCDEKRPKCLKCERSNEKCEWDSFIKFRPPTGLPGSRGSTPSGPVTLQITSDSEVRPESRAIRPGAQQRQTADQSLKDTVEDSRGPGAEALVRSTSPPRIASVTQDDDAGFGVFPPSDLCETDANDVTSNDRTTNRSMSDNQIRRPQVGASRKSFQQHLEEGGRNAGTDNAPLIFSLATSTSRKRPADCGLPDTETRHQHSPAIDRNIYRESTLQDFASTMGSGDTWSPQDVAAFTGITPMDIGTLPEPVVSPSSSYNIEDGIFEPGSTYQNLFQELRSHVFRTAHSGLVSVDKNTSTKRNQGANVSYPMATSTLDSSESVDEPQALDEDTHGRNFELRPAQEYLLWKAWTEEVSTWLDKFDSQTHFRDTFPILAKGRPHLKYAMLSLSARYLEGKNSSIPPSLTLALYQHTIQLLLPQLYMRDIAVITSCVVLCVLEMFSCSPKAWRRHLDGCASLMQSLNIRGDGGGPEEAVFWCFARMDLCGGLISLERTLIPVDKWTSEDIAEVTVSTYPRSGGFQDYAKMASNIIAQAMDLFASFHASEGAFGFSAANPTESEAYRNRWRRLFDNIQEWFSTRPMEMLPVMSMPAKDCGSPFPTVLYSNPAAISGNQFAHTAAILMLQRKPRDITLGKVRSILWHARQICGIALSNDHHGAWTNTVQPIWIAGRLMSHPQEHAAIVCLLQRIERETGWATQWRIDDLMEHWGDAED